MELFSGYLRNMLSWWQWSLLALVPPAIILLYFLKLRRTPLEVPSTYLWQKSIEDLHVNSIWQRLRRNLLLLLQLLLVLLAMIALLRPGWSGTRLSGDRFIFLIDQSASMSATDVRPTRLDEAKRRTHELVDAMPAGSRAMIISFADRAQVAQEFTDNRSLLHERVDAIRPTARGTNLRDALELSAGLANPGRTANEPGDAPVAAAQPADVYIFSDGRFPSVEGFSLGNLSPIYIPIGDAQTGNVAVTAFNTRPLESQPDKLQAFARVANFGPEPAEVDVELLAGDQLIDASRISIEPGGEQGVAYDLGEAEQGALRLEIKSHAAPSGDALAADDVAFAVVNPQRKIRVLIVTAENPSLVWALSTARASDLADVEIAEPEILNSGQYKTAAAQGTYDLVIYDRCRPEEMPQANTVFIGQLPPGPDWGGDKEAKKVAAPQIIDVERSHPLFQLIDLGNVAIGESVILAPPPGGTVLIDSSRGPICAIAPRQAFEDVVIGFEIVGTDKEGQRYANTNWHMRASFPTFWFSLISYLGGEADGTQSSSVRPGQPVRLAARSESGQLTVVSPDGKQTKISRGTEGRYQFHDTDALGVYELRDKEKTTGRLAVNLFDPSESNIKTQPDKAIQIGHVDVPGQTTWEGTRRELWKWLLLSALVVLLLEWYIYNRRVYL